MHLDGIMDFDSDLDPSTRSTASKKEAESVGTYGYQTANANQTILSLHQSVSILSYDRILSLAPSYRFPTHVYVNVNVNIYGKLSILTYIQHVYLYNRNHRIQINQKPCR